MPTTDTIHIDGSLGEGGGQMLRSSLTLSILTGRPVRITNIRAKRKKPGLMRQHLTAVQAATRICGASVTGDSAGSTELMFSPGPVAAGDYVFDIGTAGSTTLVLQTVLLPLATAGGPSRVRLSGGTHNPLAPPFDFLDRTYLPLVNRLGARVTAELLSHGFFPAGGGAIAVSIEPAAGGLRSFDLLERGGLVHLRAEAIVAHVPEHVPSRELATVRERLGWTERECSVREVRDSRGPGNVVLIELAYENVTEVISAFGERERSAESVAVEATDAARRYLKSAAPCGEHLTDQWLLPLAAAGGGRFLSSGLSLHARTHVDLIRRFLDRTVSTERLPSGDVEVRLG